MSDQPVKIMAEPFVAALLKAGIIDEHTRSVTITATVGKPVLLTVERFGDDRLLRLVGDWIVVAHTAEEAGVAR